MIVQVVPERVDQVDGVVPGSSVGVAGEQHWKDKARVQRVLFPTKAEHH